MIILKLLIGEGNFSGAGDEQFFCCWAAFSPYLQGFPPKVCEKMQDSPYLVGTTSKIKG